ncbi:MAG: NYN domain-containing protein [bacterium]|nr:NYN domain-containing protein [bacterium]
MEELVIDGCNLAYKAFGGAGRNERGALVRSLRSYYARKEIRVTVFFDSREGGGVERPPGNVKVVYASSADDAIVRHVAGAARRASMVVITDDRAVGDRARALGARRRGSREFLSSWKGLRAEAPAPEEKPSADSPDEIERYTRLWGER